MRRNEYIYGKIYNVKDGSLIEYKQVTIKKDEFEVIKDIPKVAINELIDKGYVVI